MSSVKSICIVLIAIVFFTPEAPAEEYHIRNGFWLGVDAGAGLLSQSFDEGDDEDDTYFFLGFKGGYTINPHFLIGIELSGWLVEAQDPNDPSDGEGIMQAFLITQLYPSTESGLFAKAGAGYVNNWSNKPGEPRRKEGWGFTVGGGYDFLIQDTIAVGPFATFSYGETGNWDYRAITLGLGLTLP